MTQASDMIRQGRTEEFWQKFCGFLDLDTAQFMHIQERLLMEQMHLFAASQLGRKIIGDKVPTSVAEFRQIVPLTEYEDYEPYLSEKREDVLPQMPYTWAHTSGRSGKSKWVPFTQPAYDRMGQHILAAVVLAVANKRGDVRLQPGDVLLSNTPVRPYASGVALVSLAEIFDLQMIPPMAEAEKMSFQERLEKSFQMAMVTGIDVIGSMTSVLVRIGDRFSQGANSNGFSRDMLRPRVLMRMIPALVRSRLAGRPLLPKDIWRVKGAMVGGTDTALYRDKIVEYWGVTPHENYSSTETIGMAAVQAWNKKGLFFFPDVVFLEFIPEEEWARNRQDASYEPHTVLLDEVELGQRYELVITSFDGGIFLRYRMHDFVEFISLIDEEGGINMPSMVFAGRSDGLIDLAGFTGVMDEQLIWRAIHDTGIGYVDWVVRKEGVKDGAFLHIYIELEGSEGAEEVRQAVRDSLKQLNPFYADLESMLNVQPLKVSLLSAGSFRGYFLERQAAGADLAHLKPPHMTPSNQVLGDLLRISHQLAASEEV